MRLEEVCMVNLRAFGIIKYFNDGIKRGNETSFPVKR